MDDETNGPQRASELPTANRAACWLRPVGGCILASMDRATQLIDSLDLTHHPEGGYYREVFRSLASVTVGRRGERRAITTIYFLLTALQHSSWHVVHSDEIWHFYEGDPLELITIDPATWSPRRSVLGPLTDGQRPVCVVSAGRWQAARPLGDYTLVGCSVAPGFEFADFQLMRDDLEAKSRLMESAPEMAALL